jgi:hypothetical protein
MAVNAKNIAFSKPGAGVSGYGITERNLYPKLTKLYGARADKAGGSKAIWDAMVTNTGRSLGRSRSPVALEFQNFLNTGKMPSNPTPQFQEYAAESLDYGLRETGRAQQHKNTFADSLLGKLTGVALQIGGTMVGGPLGGAAAGALYGGTVGGDGWGDALMGGLQGYGVGTGYTTLANTAASTGGWAASAANPGTFGKNLLSNLNPFSGNGAGALANAGSNAGTGGTMGAFSDFMGPVKGFLGNFDYGSGNLLGDAVGAGLNYFGSQRAANMQNDAANRAFANSQFTPYNINTPGGSASFNGTTATGALSPAAQGLLGQYQGNMNTGLTAFNKFDPNKFSNQMYRELSNLRAPEVTRANNDLLSNTYNLGQWGSTVGANNVFSQDMANNLQDQALRLQSRQAGATESDRLFNQYMNSAKAYQGLLNSPSDFINQGFGGGAQRSAANQGANSYPWMAAQNSADASAAFWSNLGTTFQNASSSNVTSGLNRQTRYQSVMGPNGYMIDIPVS